MSVLGAILGKRTWLGAGAILLSAAGGCALGALLMVKGVLPETGDGIFLNPPEESMEGCSFFSR